jgi:hypothetical protein
VPVPHVEMLRMLRMQLSQSVSRLFHIIHQCWTVVTGCMAEYQRRAPAGLTDRLYCCEPESVAQNSSTLLYTKVWLIVMLRHSAAGRNACCAETILNMNSVRVTLGTAMGGWEAKASQPSIVARAVAFNSLATIIRCQIIVCTTLVFSFRQHQYIMHCEV